MYYYNSCKEETFFEDKRFCDDKLPTNGDLDFLNGSDILKNKNIILGPSEEKISCENWEKLKPILYFSERSAKIETLRKPALMNCPELKKYILNGEIIPFEKHKMQDGKNLIQKMKEININTYSSMYEYFATGQHIGTCGYTSKFYGIIFKNPEYHVKGLCQLLKGTKGCSTEKPSHAWLETEMDGHRYIVDTSLLMLIPVELKEILGYKDLKRPVNRDELLEFYDEDDKLYVHYDIESKKSVVNKASYNNYIETIKKIKEQEQR